jgi:hypothetical protein
MKSAAVFLILSLAFAAAVSMPQESPESSEEEGPNGSQEYPDPCQLKPVVGAKCGVSEDFGKCIACLVDNCYAQAMADQGNCDAHKQCINAAVCA